MPEQNLICFLSIADRVHQSIDGSSELFLHAVHRLDLLGAELCKFYDTGFAAHKRRDNHQRFVFVWSLKDEIPFVLTRFACPLKVCEVSRCKNMIYRLQTLFGRMW